MSKRILALGLVALMVFCVAAQASKPKVAPAAEKAEPVNIIPNGDFDEGEAGAETKGKLPLKWRARFASQGPLEIVKETCPGSKGTQCLKINGDEKLKSSGAYSQLVPIDGAKPLLISGWMKGGGVMKIPQGSYFGVGWFDKDKKGIPIRPGTTMNYTYLHSGYKPDKWIFRRNVYKPSPEPKERYKAGEIPHGTAFFDVRIFVLEYPKGAMFDDIFATQDPAVIEALTSKK